MNTEEAGEFLEKMRKEKVKKLTDVGFTKEQAEVLLDMIQATTLFGGLF